MLFPAIVEFKVNYTVYTVNNVVHDSSGGLISVGNIHGQSEVLGVNWGDGDQLDIQIRGLDVLGSFDDEFLTVYKDTSPAIVENLWLTRDGRTDIYVHSIEDFTKMT